MRTRTINQGLTTSVGNANYTWIRLNGTVGTNVNYPAPATVLGSSMNNVQTIIDETEVKLKREGYCKHTKAQGFIYEFSSPVTCTYISPQGPHTLTMIGGYLPYTYFRTRVGAVTLSPTVEVVDWASMSYHALESMQPKFSEASFLNSIIELKQIRSICRPYGRKKTLLGKLANIDLWYHFGVKPLVGDVQEILRLSASLQATIDKLILEYKVPRKRHYKAPLGKLGINLPNPVKNYVIENAASFREVSYDVTFEWLSVPVYHATLRYRFDIEALTQLRGKTMALVQSLGVDKPLSVVWNAIPYSFVVDWFTNLGEWIDSLQPTSVLPIVIEDFSHSVKYSYRGEFALSVWQGRFKAPVAHRVVSHYERRREIPRTTLPLSAKLPSLAQFRLGASLLLGRKA